VRGTSDMSGREYVLYSHLHGRRLVRNFYVFAQIDL